MAEEPSLPKLLPRGPSKKTVVTRSSPRKKRFHSSSVHFSSDPPLFSSDDDPGLDNYADPHRRHNRKYRVGPYAQHPLTITSNTEDGGPQRKLQRHVDSAVFMAGDETEDDTDIEFLKSSKALTNHITLAARPSRLPNRALPAKDLSVDDRTRRDIENMLENGKDSIDLAYRNLASLSNAAIKPLASFSPLAARMQSGGSQYAEDPSLKIYLAQNCLTRLPTELFDLEHLSVLSLRNNEIKELPENIQKLTGLKELNVAQNGLKWLPYKLLNLLQFAPRLTILRLHPNPFVAPRNLPIGGVECSLKLQLGENWEAKRYRRSYVRFFDAGGRLLKGPGLDSSTFTRNPLPSNPQFYHLDADDDDIPQPPTGSAATYVSSLVEMCTKAWAKAPETMPGKHDYDLPPKLHSVLEDVKNTQELEGGLRKCTMCYREYVTPRTEWFEWWAIHNLDEDEEPDMSGGEDRYDRFTQATVPLVRRGCSWRCLPQ